MFSVLCGVYMAFYIKKQKEQYDKNMIKILKELINERK